VVSVRAGLDALALADDEPVLIHDGARPFLTPAHIDALLAALQHSDGALPALPVADTLKRADGGVVKATIDRAGLWRAQTPQAFRYAEIVVAYAAWPGPDEPTRD
jgi:2-C-methyl-D-erythritol 4-phosphate cytidylyltransferase/2-C-methyl-D-erythritol 2,4-cyclodiphosphate synthase